MVRRAAEIRIAGFTVNRTDGLGFENLSGISLAIGAGAVRLQPRALLFLRDDFLRERAAVAGIEAVEHLCKDRRRAGHGLE